MNRLLLVTASVVFGVGCASPAAQPVSEVTAPSDGSIYRVSDPSGKGLQSVVLEPMAVSQISGPAEIDALTFEVGAIYAFKGTGAKSRHNLGLVIEASSASTRPTFRSDRRLLLELDGRVFMSPPPNPSPSLRME